MKIITSLKSIITQNPDSIDAIIVEGYDGVGKGRVLNYLSDFYRVVPYRPDYNLWMKYDLRVTDRWKISGFFWDIYSHFNITHPGKVMLFDRGVLSGAVYNHDTSIAKDYKKILGKSRVLHVLVTCSQEDFIKFQKIRDPNRSDFNLGYSWCEYTRYTEDYINCLEISGVDYIVYDNKFDESIAEASRKYCEGCGHYSYGVCRHPEKNCKVDPKEERCNLSLDKETQDREEEEDNVKKVYSLQS